MSVRLQLAEGEGKPATIMIVDDTPYIRLMLKDKMEVMGYQSISADNGLSALARLRQATVDVILCDLMMPEMDGFKFLETLKADNHLCDIPVIMISALDDTESVVRCIDLGAIDFLFKPFDDKLLKVRVESVLRDRKLNELERNYFKLIEGYNVSLENEVREKTDKLVKANEQLNILDQSKNDFLKLISHELRTPLNGISVAGELAFAGGTGEEDLETYREIFNTSYRRLLAIVEQALLLTQIQTSEDSFTLKPLQLTSILPEALEKNAALMTSKSVGISVPNLDGIQIKGENKLLVEAFSAVFETAIKFSSEGQTIELRAELAGEQHRLVVETSGYSIPAEVLPRFFEILSIGEAIVPGGDFGLAPPLAERVFRLFGSRIEVENTQDNGVKFLILLS
jgi:two-component system, sensor histidine kinase and response regulator